MTGRNYDRDTVIEDLKLLRLMSESTIEVCRSMQGVELNPSKDPFLFDPQRTADLECGSCISVGSTDISCNLALFGDTSSCRKLAGHLLGTPPEEIATEDVADALGEIVNMVAGVAKRKLPAVDANNVVIGLPLFLSGTDCFRYLSKGMRATCQPLTGPAFSVEVIVVWRESE
jgi:CheY-specific phosphatase CheX